MNRTVVTCLFLGGMAALADAQVSSPTFDVASVKRAGQAVQTGRLSPGQFRVSRMTLVQLIGRAYPPFAFDGLVLGGPAWARETQFEINARMAPGTTPAQLAQMVSALLADRFALRTHTERRPVNIYVLKMARTDGTWGPQLTRADPSCVDAQVARTPFPPQCLPTATSGLHYRTMQIGDFLRLLSAMGIDRPVYDRTGLTGHFDVQLQYDDAPFSGLFAGADATSPASIGGVSFFTALQEQAGLKLEAVREMVDVIVIDSAEIPAPD